MAMNALLVGILVICMGTDIYNRKIYNAVLFPSLLITITYKLFVLGVSAFLASLTGLLAGIGILLIPYVTGGMGAGDVKLLGVIGAIKGVGFLLPAFVYMALFGGAMAILMIVFRKRMWLQLRDMLYFYACLRSGFRYPVTFSRALLAGSMPYGVAIGAGAIYCLYANGGWVG